MEHARISYTVISLNIFSGFYGIKYNINYYKYTNYILFIAELCNITTFKQLFESISSDDVEKFRSVYKSIYCVLILTVSMLFDLVVSQISLFISIHFLKFLENQSTYIRHIGDRTSGTPASRCFPISGAKTNRTRIYTSARKRRDPDFRSSGLFVCGERRWVILLILFEIFLEAN